MHDIEEDGRDVFDNSDGLGHEKVNRESSHGYALDDFDDDEALKLAIEMSRRDT